MTVKITLSRIIKEEFIDAFNRFCEKEHPADITWRIVDIADAIQAARTKYFEIYKKKVNSCILRMEGDEPVFDEDKKALAEKELTDLVRIQEIEVEPVSTKEYPKESPLRISPSDISILAGIITRD